jgi:hypothetical protein
MRLNYVENSAADFAVKSRQNTTLTEQTLTKTMTKRKLKKETCDYNNDFTNGYGYMYGYGEGRYDGYGIGYNDGLDDAMRDVVNKFPYEMLNSHALRRQFERLLISIVGRFRDDVKQKAD